MSHVIWSEIWLWSKIARTLEGSTPILSLLWKFVTLSVEGTAATRPHDPAEMRGNTTDLWQFFQQESHLGPPGSSSEKNVCQNEPQVWYLDIKYLPCMLKSMRIYSPLLSIPTLVKGFKEANSVLEMQTSFRERYPGNSAISKNSWWAEVCCSSCYYICWYKYLWEVLCWREHLVSYQALKVPPCDVKQCQYEYCPRGEEKS